MQRAGSDGGLRRAAVFLVIDAMLGVDDPRVFGRAVGFEVWGARDLGCKWEGVDGVATRVDGERGTQLK